MLKNLGTKGLLSILWLIFTVTLVSWWVYLFFHQSILPEPMERMFFLEGSVLLITVIGGGVALVVMSLQDQRRHKQLKFFFSQFSHDLKTSITRLRLQSEILLEDLGEKERQRLELFVQNINLLDMQLENSLWMSRIDELVPHLQKTSLSKLIASVKLEFPDLMISLGKDLEILCDERFMISIFRNLFHNSLIHGKSTQIQIQIKQEDSEKIELVVTDNGQGSELNHQLGLSPVDSTSLSGSGLGLFLSHKLMHLQDGEIQFQSELGKHFSAHINLQSAKKGYL